MKLAYFDCFAGIAGDMTLGALIDLGADREQVEAAVRSLGVEGFNFEVVREARASIGGTRVIVEVTAKQPHRHLHHIEKIIAAGNLSDAVKARSMAVFRLLTEAEARVHRQPVEKVHLHEVGAVDAIVDVVGSVVALELLGIERIVCSPITLGRGMTRGDHGAIPVPGPATLELLRGRPVRQGPVEAEMTTPTGAALMAALADDFGALPDMAVSAVGYGCGTRAFDELPNLLRVVVGEGREVPLGAAETVRLLEANLDDLSPQVVAHVVARALEAGALDAWVTPVVMKKGRAGHVLHVLATPATSAALSSLVFQETTTLGLRTSEVSRAVLARHWDEVETAYGTIRVKVGSSGAAVMNAVPEYDDCARVASANSVPLKEVQAAALDAWRRLRAER